MIGTFRIIIAGVVQGVGFRPFIYRLAQSLNICGTVRNMGGAVDIIITADRQTLDDFIGKIRQYAPPGSHIQNITLSQLPQSDFKAFSIIRSSDDKNENAYISVDLPMCENCRRELYDSSDSRFLYPFISCTACGPRYSIIEKIPYDRPNTTMKDFPMCGFCTEQYYGDDRRNHAQTVSCHSCGPQLLFMSKDEKLEKQAAFNRAAYLLNLGGLIAVKGIGGYHLVCSPFMESAVNKLRLFKNRDKKPFAIMFSNIEQGRKYCEINDCQQDLLRSAARPIVLCPKNDSEICPSVYGDSSYLGVFLPYTPLQCLLLDRCGPLIFTSANITNEPIIKDDAAMLEYMSKLDGILYNTRKIVTPLDDSVAHVVLCRSQLIRRSRGYVPAALSLPSVCEKQIFACGGDLKAAFSYYKNGNIYFSQHFGDLENAQVYDVYKQSDRHMSRLFDFEPNIVACDLNPAYYSTNYGKEKKLKTIAVQHHHSHVASVMAEHGITEIIGVALDGMGYGTDEAVWGCEFMLCRGAHMKRLAHLDYIKVCGYNNAAKNAKLLTNCGLYSALNKPIAGNSLLESALDNNINTVQCGSMGRLFDMAASLLGICQYNSYEGQCAIMLENAAQAAINQHIPPVNLRFSCFEADNLVKIDQNAIIRQLSEAIEQKENPCAVALGFHNAVSEIIFELCKRFNFQYNINKIALCGGVFANRILLERTAHLLENHDFEVYINEKVPTNDGGIALGQTYVALKLLEEN